MGEPLFAEDWWVDDQKLFEDSLIRQQPSSFGTRRRSARAGTIRKRKRPTPPGLVQDMLQGSANSREPTTVNQYGEMARRHWARWLPGRFAAIENPEAFFTSLGDEAEQKITALAWELAGDDPPGEEYLDKVGRLGEARHRAEQMVLNEMILLPPEPGTGPASPQ